MARQTHNDGPFQGPMFRIECNGMHHDPNDPHFWVEDSRHRFDYFGCLTESCMA